MGQNTAIQWCHDTVNPVSGCDGCPLWPRVSDLVPKITNRLAEFSPHIPVAELKERVRRAFGSCDAPDRDRIGQARAALSYLLRELVVPPADRHLVERGVMRLFRCYAGVMTHRFAGRSKGYPSNFDLPQQFPNRMRKAAKPGPPVSAEIANKPWLAGLRRLIFVSDMGDALSERISFEFLRQEIIDIVASPEGSRHLWLWLTKRPVRMAEFSDWLAKRDRPWPPNLVPMSSILNAGYARQALALSRIPAVVRGYSVEPLDHGLQLPDELLGANSWVIVGGESGTGAADHPFDLRWARGLRDQCLGSGTPFFVKQFGKFPLDVGNPLRLLDGHGGDWDEWPAELRIRQFPAAFKLAAALPAVA